MLVPLVGALLVPVLSARPAGAAAGPAIITVDESVSSTDGPSAVGPAAVASDEPIGTTDGVAVLPPGSVPADEAVSVGDEDSVLAPATVEADETVAVSDVPTIAALGELTRTSLTATPTAALAGTAVQLDATVTTGVGPADEGTVTFADGATPLGPPVPVDASGQASLSTSSLGLGDHTITAVFGDGDTFVASSATTTVGIYDYTVAVDGGHTAIRGGTATFGISVSLTPGSTTENLPATVPFAVDGLPADASSDAPATVPFPQAAAAPIQLSVSVLAGAASLGDVALTFAADARSAGAELHLYDYALALTLGPRRSSAVRPPRSG